MTCWRHVSDTLLQVTNMDLSRLMKNIQTVAQRQIHYEDESDETFGDKDIIDMLHITCDMRYDSYFMNHKLKEVFLARMGETI